MKLLLIKIFTKRILDLFNRKPVELAPWDPMGALADLK